ncbi:hypothetical protein BJ165DRAFT_1478669 [Panaeolus papilionaceus]|nr:hypothetical protein BJ165DRAFT_1478669 [Panaeolus papilionaceus]
MPLQKPNLFRRDPHHVRKQNYKYKLSWMKVSIVAMIFALSAIEQVAAATCSSQKGTCKSTCTPPAYLWHGDLTGCVKGTACCIPSGCVVCKSALDKFNSEARAPCC